MYKLTKHCVVRVDDSAQIPFDHANTDYQQFKIDVAEGATLLDADGNTMSQEQVDAFLKELL